MNPQPVNNVTHPESPVADVGLSAFIDPEMGDGHIVDILIEERCPTWVTHWSWPAVRPILFQLLGYRKALRWADDIRQINSGAACFAYLDRVLGLKVTAAALKKSRAPARL